MGEDIPGGNFLGGNFPGDNLPVGSFPDTVKEMPEKMSENMFATKSFKVVSLHQL